MRFKNDLPVILRQLRSLTGVAGLMMIGLFFLDPPYSFFGRLLSVLILGELIFVSVQLHRCLSLLSNQSSSSS